MSALAGARSDSSLCIVGTGCHTLARTPASQFLGISLSTWGAAWVSLMLLLPYLTSGKSERMLSRVLAWAGVAVSLAMPVYAGVTYHTFCTWCLLAGASCIGLAWAVLKGLPETDKKEQGFGLKGMLAFGLACLGLLAVPLAGRLAGQPSCHSLTEAEQKQLRVAAGRTLTAKTVFVFTDFACPHCHAEVPKFVAQAKKKGFDVVALVVVKQPRRTSGDVAKHYYIANWSGYGNAYLERESGPDGMETYLKVAQQEFPATQKELDIAQAVVLSNNLLFDRLKLPGTPAYAQLKNGRFCVTTRPVDVLGKSE